MKVPNVFIRSYRALFRLSESTLEKVLASILLELCLIPFCTFHAVLRYDSSLLRSTKSHSSSYLLENRFLDMEFMSTQEE